MSIKDDRARFTFRMPEKLLTQIKTESEALGVSVNALILQILWEWVKKNTDQKIG